ncbi:MAG: amidohydrolase family protein [Eubacteriales bacterium]|nr:amidohydrolase family protein [Eubacteriales bacterium]
MNMVLTNAKVYTCKETAPWAETVVIRDGCIVYAGSSEKEKWEEAAGIGSSEAAAAKDTLPVYDMKGKMIIPGIIDSHTHPGMVSQSSWHIRLPWTEDVNELLAFVKKYAEEHPVSEAPFLYFEYYPTSMFGENGPTKELLDSAVSDRPCLCQDFGDHLHWVNSRMLEMMGVTKDTPDPVPGLEMFVRDADGEPTGWLKEYVHMRFADKLFRTIGWTPPMTMTPDLMEGFFRFLTEHGITAMADGILEGEAQLSSMAELDQSGKLNVYYDGIMRFWSYEDLPEKIAELQSYQQKYTSKHMKLNTMKLFLDGTNESGNSALLSPHLNDPKGINHGEIKMDRDELKNCLLLCNRTGLDIHIHMVGDRAFRVGCDAVEAAQKEAAKLGETWTMQVIFAHCELIDPADMPRPAQLGITINWSCHWSAGYFGEEAQTYIGREKWNRMYQFNPIIDSGALVTFSSDVVTYYELHRADPFFSMQVAHTRVDPEFPLNPGTYPGSMRPEESARLSREALMKGYTISGARQLRWEDQLGSIEAGKIANLNVISDDFFKVAPDHISGIKLDAVIFDGEVIFGML